MKITSWNIQHGEVYSNGIEIDKLAEIASAVQELNCDVLILQEVDHLNDRSNLEEQSKFFASLLKTEHWSFAPTVWRKDDSWQDWPTHDDLKFPPLISIANSSNEAAYGISIISKIPVMKWERKELSKAWFGWWLPHTANGVTKKYWVKDHARNALAAYFPDGKVLINTHLSWEPIFRNIQLFQLKRWANKIARNESLQVIIAGDLNIANDWQESVNSLRWRSIVKQKTFPIWKPDRQIDHFLTRPKTEVNLEPVVICKVSDHLPISISIT